MANFNEAIKFVFRWEGGETTDTGGYTKYGISQKAYPNLNISALTLDQARAIYRRDYWDKIQGDKIQDQGNALALLDYAVNAGTGRAVQDAQRVLNAAGYKLAVDGGLGPLTLAAINRRGPLFAAALTAERKNFYNRLVQQNPEKYRQYLRGWLRRADNLLETAKIAITTAGSAAVPLLIAGLTFFLLTKK
jgi:lysozyme family protein